MGPASPPPPKPSKLMVRDDLDLERAVKFYEQVTGVAAVRYTPH
jgi:predicted enzyme related to lactoylglutathione lyase